MEKFKACEKEMKTKAFSKEGLIQAAKLDPKEQEKEDAMQWIQQQVEELQMQVEATEAEVEALQGQTKKKSKASSAAERLEELETLNDRRKWHINKLEIILRLTNNGSISADRINGLKEDVQYFVTSNTVRLGWNPALTRYQWHYRRTTLISMRGSTMSSTSMKLRESSGLCQRMTMTLAQRRLVKVRYSRLAMAPKTHPLQTYRRRRNLPRRRRRSIMMMKAPPLTSNRIAQY